MNDDTNQFQTFVIENNYRIIKRRNKISLWSNNRIRNFIWKLCKSNSSERFTQNCRLIVILCAESRHNTTDLSRMWMSNEVCVWGSKIPLLHHNMKIRLILTSHIIKVYLDKNCNGCQWSRWSGDQQWTTKFNDMTFMMSQTNKRMFFILNIAHQKHQRHHQQQQQSHHIFARMQ